ncbi:hypothetical protein MAR_011037, partial [Mya arenaria]
MPVVKELLPNVEMVHYWTDSPSSQYRNSDVFHLVTQHQEMFGVDASWDYFDAGHERVLVRFGKGQLMSQKTSCYCDVCMEEPCNTWTIHELNGNTDATHNKDIASYITKGNYVVAIYDDDWYIGQVIDTDVSDEAAEINFMTKNVLRGKVQFSWPSRKDVLWVESNKIVMEVKEPAPADRFRRFFTLSCAELDEIR